MGAGRTAPGRTCRDAAWVGACLWERNAVEEQRQSTGGAPSGALGNSDHGPFTSGQGRVTGDQIRTLTGNHLKLEHRHGIRVGRSEPRLSPRGSGRARRREHGLSGARMEEMHRESGEAKAAEPRRKELHRPRALEVPRGVPLSLRLSPDQ